MRVQWATPARPNGDIVSYTVYQRDPVQLSITSTRLTPEDHAFSDRHATLHGLAPYRRWVKTDLHQIKHCSVRRYVTVLPEVSQFIINGFNS